MHRRMIVILATASLAAAGCDREGAGEPPDVQEVEARALDPALAAHLPQGVSIETAQEGRDLYPECGVCHGLEGEGTRLGSALNDAAWASGSGELGEIAARIRSGAPAAGEFPVPMPAYGTADFSDEQVRALAAYVFLLSRNGGGPPAPGDAPPDTASAVTDTAGVTP